MKQSVLLVDDDPLVHRLMGKCLLDNGYSVFNASNGEEALRLMRRSLPDLVVLDLGLNGIGGLDVLGAMKNDKQLARLPIIILTGSETEKMDVLCLERGADDYLNKSFEPDVFMARVKAVIRRSQFQGDKAEVLDLNDFSIDASRRAVILKDRIVENLTSKEFDLLYLLAQNSPRVLSREYIARKVWKGPLGLISSRTIDVHIRRIRQKVGPDMANRVVTAPGQGYKFLKD